MTVADLLLRSRTSALSALRASKDVQVERMHAAYQDALDARMEAHAADPDHLDPAWLLDTRNHRGELKRTHGQTPQQVSQQHHQLLVAHFERQLDGTDFIQTRADVTVNRDGGEPDKTKHVGPVTETVTFLKRAQPAQTIHPLSDDEIQARILTPDGSDPAKSLAFQQLMREQGR